MVILKYGAEIVQTHIGGGSSTKRPKYAKVFGEKIAGTAEVLGKYVYLQTADAQYCDKCGQDDCEMYIAETHHVYGYGKLVDDCKTLCCACVEYMTVVDALEYVLEVNKDGHWENVAMCPTVKSAHKLGATFNLGKRLRIVEVTRQIQETWTVEGEDCHERCHVCDEDVCLNPDNEENEERENGNST